MCVCKQRTSPYYLHREADPPPQRRHFAPVQQHRTNLSKEFHVFTDDGINPTESTTNKKKRRQNRRNKGIQGLLVLACKLRIQFIFFKWQIKLITYIKMQVSESVIQAPDGHHAL